MKPTLTLSILFAGCLLSAYALQAQTPAESSTPAATPAPAKKARAAKPTPTPRPVASPTEATPTPQEEANNESGGDGKDRVAFGSNVTIAEGDTVKDAVSFGGNVEVLGTVTHDAVSFGGNVKLGPNARVRGHAVTFGGTVDVSPGGKLDGGTVQMGDGVNLGGPLWRVMGPHSVTHGCAYRVKGVVWQIAWLAFFAFCALLLTVFVPQHLFRIEEHLTGAFPRSALMGLAAMIGLPLITLILVATCVGILLVPLLALVVFATAVMGYIAFAHILGQRLLSTAGVFIQILAGLLLLQSAGILAAFVALPGGAFATAAFAFHLLDKFAFLVSSFLGLGAVLLSRWGRNALPPQQA